MTQSKEHTPQAAKEPHTQILRWNISDDHYNDGMVLYADGSLHINIGGHVWVRSLRGWFELSETNERLVRENNRMRGALERIKLLMKAEKFDGEFVGIFINEYTEMGIVLAHALYPDKGALESPLDKQGDGEKC